MINLRDSADVCCNVYIKELNFFSKWILFLDENIKILKLKTTILQFAQRKGFIDIKN